MADESLQELAEMFGLTVDDTIRADFWPADAGQITRFVDHKTNTRIRIINTKTE